MDLKIPQELLISKIKQAGEFSVSSRQLVSRLKSLLKNDVDRLDSFTETPSRKGKAKLKKYTESSYLESVDSYLSLRTDGLTAQIEYETYTMLYKARQSLNFYRKTKS